MAVTSAFDPDPNLLFDAFETTDEIGKILRCHLAVELQLESLIRHVSKASVDKRTSFWGKINLLRAMGVSERLCKCCELLNDLRNLLAHNPKANIGNSKSISDRFLAAAEELMPILVKSHGAVERRGVKITYEYAAASQIDRVVVACSWLTMAIGLLPKLFTIAKPVQVAKMPNLEF